jgi:hypothetical protein
MPALKTLGWYVPAILLGVSPLVTVIGANLESQLLDTGVIARSVLVAAAAVVVLIWALKPLQRDLAARAAWVCWFLMLFNVYGACARGLRSLGLYIWAADPLFAIPYVLTAAVVAALLSRPWEVRAREPLPLLLAAVVLLGAGAVPAAARERRPEQRWRPAADRLVASALSHAASASPAEPRDIYYIVLDGLGRPDTLQRVHGLDLGRFVNALRDKGFYVAAGARTNYSQTYLSLASTLNMTYLDDLAAAVGASATTRDPLAYMIQENALMKLASRAGFRIVAIGSNNESTRRLARADVCVCEVDGLDELELAAIGLTPLAAVPLDVLRADPYELHRRKVLGTFAAVEGPAVANGRSFVFAHVLAPHPPFVFARDGSPRQPDRPYTTSDADDFPGSEDEYEHGYSEQTQFILGRLLRVVDTLLSRPGPAPVIVVHGDHGPKSARGADAVNAVETMDIFAAYYFPGGNDALYPAITPINAARALANQYLGGTIPPVPDRSFYARWDRPYTFIPNPASQ